MEKQDIKALTRAYLGCFILTALFIMFFKNGSVNVKYLDYVLMGCIAIGGISVIKDYPYWGYAIEKICKNLISKIKTIK